MNSYKVAYSFFQEYIQRKVNTIFIYHLINADKASATHHAHQSIRHKLYPKSLQQMSCFPLFGRSLLSLSPTTNYLIYQNYQFLQNNSPSVPGKATAVTVAAPYHM
jgi:hypothetical protein